MNRTDFRETANTELQRLFQAACARDELAFLFAVLGIDSGMEDAGWQPIGEAQAFVQDLLGLINGPLHQHAKVRTALLLYCHIIDANFIYHCLYNLLLTVRPSTAEGLQLSRQIQERHPTQCLGQDQRDQSQGDRAQIPGYKRHFRSDRSAGNPRCFLSLGLHPVRGRAPPQIPRFSVRPDSPARSAGACAKNRRLVQSFHGTVGGLASFFSQGTQDHGQKIPWRARSVLRRGAGRRARLCDRIPGIRRIAAVVRTCGASGHDPAPVGEAARYSAIVGYCTGQ